MLARALVLATPALAPPLPLPNFSNGSTPALKPRLELWAGWGDNDGAVLDIIDEGSGAVMERMTCIGGSSSVSSLDSVAIDHPVIIPLCITTKFSRVYSGWSDGTVRCHCALKRSLIFCIKAHSTGISSICVTNGALQNDDLFTSSLATGSEDGLLLLWSASDGTSLQKASLHVWSGENSVLSSNNLSESQATDDEPTVSLLMRRRSQRLPVHSGRIICIAYIRGNSTLRHLGVCPSGVLVSTGPGEILVWGWADDFGVMGSALHPGSRELRLLRVRDQLSVNPISSCTHFDMNGVHRNEMHALVNRNFSNSKDANEMNASISLMDELVDAVSGGVSGAFSTLAKLITDDQEIVDLKKNSSLTTNLDTDVIITGHDDGSLLFWMPLNWIEESTDTLNLEKPPSSTVSFFIVENHFGATLHPTRKLWCGIKDAVTSIGVVVSNTEKLLWIAYESGVIRVIDWMTGHVRRALILPLSFPLSPKPVPVISMVFLNDRVWGAGRDGRLASWPALSDTVGALNISSSNSDDSLLSCKVSGSASLTSLSPSSSHSSNSMGRKYGVVGDVPPHRVVSPSMCFVSATPLVIRDLSAASGVRGLDAVADIEEYNLIWRVFFDHRSAVMRNVVSIDDSSDDSNSCLPLSIYHRIIRLYPSFTIANVSNISSIMALGTTVLHFAGHGASDSLGGLHFEGDGGAAHVVTPSMICEFFRCTNDKVPKSGTAERLSSIGCVVISMCHSLAAGEAFVSAGVAHVICVEGEVLDSSTHVFAHAFYSFLLGGKTVLRSFNGALESLRICDKVGARSDSSLFRLLPADAAHENILFSSLTIGNEFRQMSNLPSLAVPAWLLSSSAPSLLNDPLPPLTEDYGCRRVEEHFVISTLSNRRVVSVIGEKGIGKSSLLLSVSRYLSMRNEFPGGIIFVSLDNVPIVCDDVRENFILNLVWNSILERSDGRASKDSPRANGGSVASMLLGWLDRRRCLVVVDGAEKFVDFNGGKEVLCNAATTLLLAPSVCLLFSSIVPLNIPREKIVLMSSLCQLDSARLLLKACPRAISPEELGCSYTSSASSFKEKMILAMARHELVDACRGNPSLICLAAKVLGCNDMSTTVKLISREVAGKVSSDVLLPEGRRHAIVSRLDDP